MCFDLNARPPYPPIAGGAADGQSIVLESADGTRFAAYAARAEQPSGAGMIVLPDVRGLHPYYEELALRFAEAGINSVAIDYFGRTGGVARRDDPDFDWMTHVQQTKLPQLNQDIDGAAAYLRSEQGGGATALFSVGFCFGGLLSSLQSTSPRDMAGDVSFYGWPLGLPLGDLLPKAVDQVDRMRAPLLLLYGGADQGIPPDAIEQFDAALDRAGVTHETQVYEGAPHSFFDRTYEQYATESDDAWRRMLDFIKRNS